MNARSRRWSVAFAQAVLSKQEASGLSVAAFARREGLDTKRLYEWRQRLREKNASQADAPPAAPAVVEIRQGPRRNEAVEIVLQSGVTLRVSETIDPSALARLVTVMR